MSSHPALISEAPGSAGIYLTDQADWNKGIAVPDRLKAQAMASGFEAGEGQMVWVASAEGEVAHVLFGMGDGQSPLILAGLAARLPEGDYHIERDAGLDLATIGLGWSDGAYRFQRYVQKPKASPRLVIGEDIGAAAIRLEAGAIDRLRDMVNTPAEDMGPEAIQAVIEALAERYGASLNTCTGEALLRDNYPMVHAVGRAGPQAPRLMELSWGKSEYPELAIIGKGVAFDTGGLNLKTGNYMRLMKKDMGGAAHAIALAELVMGAALPVHLKLYVPAVENGISGNAFRPGDILNSRKGLTVEIDNTDAEGRLILGDALARACESSPDLVIDFATLTGAARVAVGPDLAPFYTDDADLVTAMQQASADTSDPVWHMPLWQPYKSMLKSPIADIVNSASSSFAGSITAALFLQHFVDAPRWIHLDVWAWREAKYGRPAGGAACGLRAVWRLLQTRYG